MHLSYYAHYTFIYPDIFLKNHVVSVDAERRITGYHAFVEETPNTLFHSGLQVFVPQPMAGSITPADLLRLEPLLEPLLNEETLIRSFCV